MMGAVFSMQGFGQLTGALVALITIAGFKGSLSTAKTISVCTGECALAVDKSWRILIGMLLISFSFYFTKYIPRFRCCPRMHRSLLPSHHP